MTGMRSFAVVVLAGLAILGSGVLSAQDAAGPVFGETTKGLAISFDVRPTEWRAPDAVQFTCTVKNVSDKPIRVATWGLDLKAAIEVTDSMGRVLPNEGGRNASRLVREDDFLVLAPGEARPFVLRGEITGKKVLVVHELLGGGWTWPLADGKYSVRAVFERTPTAEAGGETWTGKAFSPPVKVTVGGEKSAAAATATAGVAPARAVGGEAANGLKLTIAADKTQLKMTAPGKVEQTMLRFTFTNTSDKPIRLATYDWAWRHVKIDLTGPDGRSVQTLRIGNEAKRMMGPPSREHYPVLDSRQSLTLAYGPGFPSDFGPVGYTLARPGEYRATATYTCTDADVKLSEHAVGSWTGSVTSNEIVLKGVLAEAGSGAAAATATAGAAPARAVAGETVNGLKLTIAADRTELRMKPIPVFAATKDTPRWDVEPVKLTFTFINVSDRPIKLDAYDLVWSRMKVDVRGPDAQSVRIVKRMVEREMMAPRAQDYPVVEPGKSWTYGGWAPIPGNFGDNQYILLKPGEYRVRATYTCGEAAAYAKFSTGCWAGSVTSNEIVLKGVAVKAE